MEEAMVPNPMNPMVREEVEVDMRRRGRRRERKIRRIGGRLEEGEGRRRKE